MASGVWSTHSSTDLSTCHALRDTDSISMKSALQETGYLGPISCDYRENPLSAHFELHIEQGPMLERQGKEIGIVTSVQGMKWFAIRVTGREGHSGTTPMAGRADALVTAARLITAVRDTALQSGLGVATVGVISSDTSSQATIPAGVGFVVDVRCDTDSLVEQLSESILRSFDQVIKEEANGTTYSVERTWGLPESMFHSDCIEAVRKAAVDLVGKEQVMQMKSRAGHDSAWTSRVCPTSMIFVPSKGGISHNPEEYTSPEHCALGAQVLLDAVLEYDGKVRDGDTSYKEKS
jgi:hydantoinase/carbamoylase family amidase